MTDLADMKRDLERWIRAEDKAITEASSRRDWYRQALEMVTGMLRGAPGAEQPKPGPKARGPELEQLRAALLAALQEHGPHSTNALTVIANGHKTTVKGELARMAAAGLVHTTGNRRGQRWHLGAAPNGAITH